MKPWSLWCGLALALFAVVGGWLSWSFSDTSPAIRGKKLARELGCSACHGPEGLGGVADPLSPGGEIPDWRYTTAKLFVSSAADVRSWILHGRAPGEARRELGGHPSLVPMPGYGELISSRDADDLVAYFLAVSGWRPSYSEDAYQGWNIATRLGCSGCHGPSGMGGVPNPGSSEGYIPPLVGDQFAELVQNESELRAWILFGRIERLRSDRAAAPKTPMPAYHDHLSDTELDKLIVYIYSLQTGAQEPGQDNEAAEVIGAVVAPRRTTPLG